MNAASDTSPRHSAGFHQALNMVTGQLFTNRVTDKRILQAMVSVPREPFLPEPLKGVAYVDEDLPMGDGRMLLEPLTLARLLDLGSITDKCRVLVIGALNGYVAAVVAKLAQHVIATELDQALLDEAKKHHAELGITNVEYQLVKSLAEGYALAAPYDTIIIPGAVEAISESLGSQLSINGKLVTVRSVAERPGIEGGLGKVVVVTRVGGNLHYREHFDASTAIMPGFRAARGFAF